MNTSLRKMKKHLAKEHPSTRHRMRLQNLIDKDKQRISDEEMLEDESYKTDSKEQKSFKSCPNRSWHHLGTTCKVCGQKG